MYAFGGSSVTGYRQSPKYLDLFWNKISISLQALSGNGRLCNFNLVLFQSGIILRL